MVIEKSRRGGKVRLLQAIEGTRDNLGVLWTRIGEVVRVAGYEFFISIDDVDINKNSGTGGVLTCDVTFSLDEDSPILGLLLKGRYRLGVVNGVIHLEKVSEVTAIKETKTGGGVTVEQYAYNEMILAKLREDLRKSRKTKHGYPINMTLDSKNSLITVTYK